MRKGYQILCLVGICANLAGSLVLGFSMFYFAGLVLGLWALHQHTWSRPLLLEKPFPVTRNFELQPVTAKSWDMDLAPVAIIPVFEPDGLPGRARLDLKPLQPLPKMSRFPLRDYRHDECLEADPVELSIVQSVVSSYATSAEWASGADDEAENG